MECICPILGRTTEVDVFDDSHEPWVLVRCRETGFVFLSNPPDYSRLTDEFAWEKSWAEEKVRRAKAEPVVARISELSKRTKTTLFPRRDKFYALLRAAAPGKTRLTILDIGCGRGSLLEGICQRLTLENRAAIPLGVEISRQLAAESGEKFAALGGRVIFSNAIDGVSQLASEEVDVVIMSSFLEHEAKPLELLTALRPGLKSAGCVILKVPNFACWNHRLRGMRWCGFRFPDHVNYFTPKTLRLLAERAGYRVARQRLQDRSPLSDNMYAVLERA